MRGTGKSCRRLGLIKMLGELNKKRYRALELIAEYLRAPPRELRLNAIICDVNEEDLQWVSDRIHHFVLRLLEEADYDPANDEEEIFETH